MIPLLMEMLSLKMLNSAIPQNIIIANAALLSPVSTPQRALNTTLKTNVYTQSIISG